MLKIKIDKFIGDQYLTQVSIFHILAIGAIFVISDNDCNLSWPINWNQDSIFTGLAKGAIFVIYGNSR